MLHLRDDRWACPVWPSTRQVPWWVGQAMAINEASYTGVIVQTKGPAKKVWSGCGCEELMLLRQHRKWREEMRNNLIWSYVRVYMQLAEAKEGAEWSINFISYVRCDTRSTAYGDDINITSLLYYHYTINFNVHCDLHKHPLLS